MQNCNARLMGFAKGEIFLESCALTLDDAHFCITIVSIRAGLIRCVLYEERFARSVRQEKGKLEKRGIV